MITLNQHQRLHQHIAQLFVLALLLCTTLSAFAHSGGMAAIAGPLVIIGLIAYFAVVLALAFVAALLLDGLLKRFGKSPGVKTLTAIGCVLFISLHFTYFVLDHRLAARKRADSTNPHKQYPELSKLICKGDPSAWQSQLPALSSTASSSYATLAIAQDCLIKQGQVTSFQTLVGIEAKIRNWGTATALPSQYCSWLEVALHTKRKDFVAAFHANQLPLHCQTAERNQTLFASVRWFNVFNDIPPEEHASWMAFLLQHGAKVDLRDDLHGQTIIDRAALEGWAELYKYLISIGVKPNESSSTLLGTSQWLALGRTCPLKPGTAALENLFPPLTSEQLNQHIPKPFFNHDPVRVYEQLLGNLASGKSESDCKRELIAILKLKPTISRPYGGLIHPKISIDDALLRELDAFSPTEAAYLLGFFNTELPGTLFQPQSDSPNSKISIQYVKSRGFNVKSTQ